MAQVAPDQMARVHHTIGDGKFIMQMSAKTLGFEIIGKATYGNGWNFEGIASFGDFDPRLFSIDTTLFYEWLDSADVSETYHSNSVVVLKVKLPVQARGSSLVFHMKRVYSDLERLNARKSLFLEMKFAPEIDMRLIEYCAGVCAHIYSDQDFDETYLRAEFQNFVNRALMIQKTSNEAAAKFAEEKQRQKLEQMRTIAMFTMHATMDELFTIAQEYNIAFASGMDFHELANLIAAKLPNEHLLTVMARLGDVAKIMSK